MIHRILHSAALLVATIVAYEGYVLALVPWIEPPPLTVSQPKGKPGEMVTAGSGESVAKYQRLLAAYFPPDHWSQTRPPLVIENESGTVMFVLDDYKRHDDGRVDLTNFTLLIFPTPRQQSVEPPRDAIILEAPGGAHLQFDKNFRPERGEIGQIQHGEFPGKITIRSDMREPGPEDDLVIETSDLRMNSKLLFTPNEVHFRLGPNVGGGRELEIRLLEEEPSKARAGLRVSSIDSLEVFRDVWLRLHLDTGKLLPGGEPAGKSHGASAAGPFGDPAQPPVELRCSGPFHFDFIKYVAGFDDNVQAWQVNPAGPADQLSCERLDICFARKEDSNVPPPRADLEAASRQRADVRWLEPDRIITEGYPAVISSPSRGIEARGSRMQLLVRQRKVAIDGGDDVSITYGPNVLHAPQIRYQHPAADAGTKIGTFRASGPGSLSYVPDEKKPEQVFQADWQASVELGRHNGQPVLTLAGRPRLNVTNMGLLTADQLRLFLREVETDGKTRPIPDRMNARGQVEIDSRELVARTRELSAVFHVAEPEEGAKGGGQAGSNSLAQFNDRVAASDRRLDGIRCNRMRCCSTCRSRASGPPRPRSPATATWHSASCPARLPAAKPRSKSPADSSRPNTSTPTRWSPFTARRPVKRRRTARLRWLISAPGA